MHGALNPYLASFCIAGSRASVAWPEKWASGKLTGGKDKVVWPTKNTQSFYAIYKLTSGVRTI
jgi:hypothetical protein